MYYPFLRWKAGEQMALLNANNNWLNDMVPIWIVEDKNELGSAISSFQTVWQGSLILDASRFGLAQKEAELNRALLEPSMRVAVTLDQYRALSPNFGALFTQKPVVIVRCESLDDAVDPDFHDDEIQKICSERLFNATIVIDLCEVDNGHINHASQIKSQITKYLAVGAPEVVLSGGSFPLMLSNVKQSGYLPRIEKSLFNAVGNGPGSPISYSDYATLNPFWHSSGTRRTNHSNLKYTLDDNWLVLREKGKEGQVSIDLATILVNDPDFRGSSFSWADGVWYTRANGGANVRPGNTTNHAAESVHHHLAQVIKLG